LALLFLPSVAADTLLIQSVEKTVLSPLKPRLILRILTHACTSRLSMAKGEH